MFCFENLFGCGRENCCRRERRCDFDRFDERDFYCRRSDFERINGLGRCRERDFYC